MLGRFVSISEACFTWTFTEHIVGNAIAMGHNMHVPCVHVPTIIQDKCDAIDHNIHVPYVLKMHTKYIVRVIIYTHNMQTAGVSKI